MKGCWPSFAALARDALRATRVPRRGRSRPRSPQSRRARRSGLPSRERAPDAGTPAFARRARHASAGVDPDTVWFGPAHYTRPLVRDEATTGTSTGVNRPRHLRPEQRDLGLGSFDRAREPWHRRFARRLVPCAARTRSQAASRFPTQRAARGGRSTSATGRTTSWNFLGPGGSAHDRVVGCGADLARPAGIAVRWSPLSERSPAWCGLAPPWRQHGRGWVTNNAFNQSVLEFSSGSDLP